MTTVTAKLEAITAKLATLSDALTALELPERTRPDEAQGVVDHLTALEANLDAAGVHWNGAISYMQSATDRTNPEPEAE